MEVKPGYKQTEVGVIPADWDVESFDQTLKRQNAKAFQIQTSSYQTNGLLPVIDQGQKAVVGYSDQSDRRFECPEEGVIVFGDHTCIVKFADFDFVVGADGTQLLTAKSGNHTRFHAYALEHKGVLSTGYNRHFKFLKERPFVRPPLPQQRAIATALSDVDGLLGGLDRLIAKKRDLKQAAMQQLLTGQTRLPGFHGAWERLNMADDSTLKARIGWQGLTTAEYLKSGDYFLVTGTDFSDGRIAWSSCCYVATERYTQDRNIQLQSNDILLTKDGTIGKVAFVDSLPKPATLNSGVFVIRPKDEAYDPRFFYYVLTSRIFEEFLAKLQAGSTISHLYQKDFVSFSFLAPPTIPEQTAIAEVLTEMDAELAVLEQRREKIRALKQAMMQELLTGRIRLVGTPAQPAAAEKSAHNWAINEAVVVAALVKRFGSEQFPLGRKRCTKLAYLLHRHVEHRAEGYLKKAAGPYNPAVKYRGPEGIARKNGYIREHTNGKFTGHVAAAKIAQAEAYFEKWYGRAALEWLDQFKFKTNDDLELLATVDMAAEDLRRAGAAPTLAGVKRVIRGHPEWEAKLDRPVFSDQNIAGALAACRELFPA